MKDVTSYKIVKTAFLISFTICLVICVYNIVFGIYWEFNTALIFLNCCIFLPILFSLKKKSFNLFEPIYIAVFNFSICFLFTGIPYYCSKNSITEMDSVIFNLSDDRNLIVIYVLGIGILFSYIGYYLAKKVVKCKSSNVFDDKLSLFSYKKLVLILYSISIIFRLYSYITGGISSLHTDRTEYFSSIPGISILFFISNLWSIYLFFISLLYFHNNKYFKLFVAFLFVESLITLMSGDRRNFLTIAFSVLIPYYYISNGQFPWRKIITIFIFFILIIFPFITVFSSFLAEIEHLTPGNLIVLVNDSFMELVNFSFANQLHYITKSIHFVYSYLWGTMNAYTMFDLNNVYYENHLLKVLCNGVLPSFMRISDIDSRLLTNVFTYPSIIYNMNDSWLYIPFQVEIILSYGLLLLPFCMFVKGFVMNLIYLYMTSSKRSLYFSLCYWGMFFNWGFYGFTNGVTDSLFILSIRILVYCMIFNFLRKAMGTILRLK